MNKYKKPKFDEGSLGVNPYVESLVVDVNRVPFLGAYKKVADGYEQMVTKVEYDPVCKLYMNSEKRKHMAVLKDRSKSLLLWVMYELESGKDFLWVNRVRYMEENEINSVNTYKSAIDDLVRYGFLGKTVVQGVYWINPFFFFSGNRIVKFPKNVKERG